MSLSPSLFLLFLRMNSTYMTPWIPQTLTTRLQTPQYKNTSSLTSRGEPLMALRHSTTWFSPQVHQAKWLWRCDEKMRCEDAMWCWEDAHPPHEEPPRLEAPYRRGRSTCMIKSGTLKDIVYPPPHTQTPHNHDSTLLPSTSPSPSPPSSPPPKRSRKSRAN